MADPIRVVVHGALGKMGREVVNSVCQDPEARLVGAVDVRAKEEHLTLPRSCSSIPFSSDLESVLRECRPNVLVDFTVAPASMAAARVSLQHKVGLVIGTTGLSPSDLGEIDRLAKEGGLGAVVASNFALGAVMMMHLAREAAKYFDWAEIIELHHEQKVDAPSGTALSTAKAMVEARGRPFSYASPEKETLASARGGHINGVGIHSVRMPGLSAHQEVILGAPGQTLTIRHDTIDRRCYMPGVLLAVKKVGDLRGLVVGLDRLLGLNS